MFHSLRRQPYFFHIIIWVVVSGIVIVGSIYKFGFNLESLGSAAFASGIIAVALFFRYVVSELFRR
ncbi:MAG: hypothetical protein K8T25_12895 [Planctomycetia bacterium]|nr:hypothetical protein [Planctomycetia bacterium]